MKNKLLLMSVVIFFITILPFSQAMMNGFVGYDDGVYIIDNPNVVGGLTTSTVLWAFTTLQGGNWHPLTWLSHMLDCQIYGLAPWGHHLTSLLLHALNGVLLFLLLSITTRTLWRSTFVALLFALHPLHVESVAWVAERKDLLSTFFFFLSLLAYVKFVKSRRTTHYLGVGFFFICGLLSKPMVVTLPVVLLLLDFWPLERLHIDNKTDKTPLYRLVLEKIPFLILAVGGAALAVYSQMEVGALADLETLTIVDRIENSLVTYATYIVKMVWPVKLAVIYPLGEALKWWQIVGSVFILGTIAIGVFIGAPRHRYLITGLLWYIITLIPVIGIVQVGQQQMADRYTYIPLIGLFIIISWGIGDFLVTSPRIRSLTIFLMTVLTLVLAMLTAQQVRHWKDMKTLFKHAVEITDNNYVAHNNLGVAFHQQGEKLEALANYRLAITINPRYATGHYNLGLILSELGNTSEAAYHYQIALLIDPGYQDARDNLNLLLGKGIRSKWKTPSGENIPGNIPGT